MGPTNSVAVTCSVKAVNGVGASAAATAAVVTPRALADLGVSIDNGVGFIIGGGTVTYQIVVGNDGPSAVTGAQLVNEPGSTLTAIAWTCTSAGGATCPAANGTGAIGATVNLPAGGSLHYTLSGSVPVLPETPLVHSVSVLPPNSALDGNAANDVAVDGLDAVGCSGMGLSDLGADERGGISGRASFAVSCNGDARVRWRARSVWAVGPSGRTHQSDRLLR